jgi:uncharacterized repeat protein (TIGR01451 family)
MERCRSFRPPAAHSRCGDAGACNGFPDAFVTKIGGTPPLADLKVANSAMPSPVPSGAELTYTIVARNAGPSTAQAVTILDPVLAGTTFVSVATTTGSCTAPPVGQPSLAKCSGFNLNNGASVTETLVVSAKAATGSTVTDQALVHSATPDPKPANNSITVMASVS